MSLLVYSWPLHLTHRRICSNATRAPARLSTQLAEVDSGAETSSDEEKDLCLSTRQLADSALLRHASQPSAHTQSHAHAHSHSQSHAHSQSHSRHYSQQGQHHAQHSQSDRLAHVAAPPLAPKRGPGRPPKTAGVNSAQGGVFSSPVSPSAASPTMVSTTPALLAPLSSKFKLPKKPKADAGGVVNPAGSEAEIAQLQQERERLQRELARLVSGRADDDPSS